MIGDVNRQRFLGIAKRREKTSQEPRKKSLARDTSSLDRTNFGDFQNAKINKIHEIIKIVKNNSKIFKLRHILISSQC
jgi:hypothetical protein